MKLAFIIDDDPVFREKASKFLATSDYEVREFNFGWEGLQSLTENPDLIVLDHRLEVDASGLDYLVEIKTRKPQIPIVFLSGQESLTISFLLLHNSSETELEQTHQFLIETWKRNHCLN